MEIVLLKTPIFKYYGDGMVVPGLVDFTQESIAMVVGEDWYLCDKFRDTLIEIREKLSNPTNDLYLKFKLIPKPLESELAIHHFDYEELEAVTELEDQSTILQNVKEKLFPKQVVRFEAAVNILGLKGPNNNLSECFIEQLGFDPKEMTVDETTNKFCYKNVAAEAPNALSVYNFQAGHRFAMVTVTMTLSKLDLDHAKSPSDINRKIFTEELDSDTIIIPGSGGNPVKCHRSFLMANSPVFLAMFQTDMDEAKSSEVKIKEMDEDVVRAFLAYLYYRDESKPNLKFGITFQLLTAGHKYQIPELVNVMSALLVYKPVEWYDDVELAVKLYLFARNLDDGEELKTKALIAMKAERSALQKCTAFRDLFKDNTDVAMEMFEDMAGIDY